MKFSEAVKSLFVTYSDGLNRFVYQKLGNIDDAQEIVQDTFHNYLRIEDQEDIENPQAFLYKTAHNLALNHIRKSGYRAAHLQTLDDGAQSVSLEREVFSQRDVENLQEHLNKLPELTRKIFLSNRMDGKTYPEISQDFAISLGSVQKHMVKALNYLRRHLDR
jgi:RNA polymerase sigma-70 factor (ECF subfamily)